MRKTIRISGRKKRNIAQYRESALQADGVRPSFREIKTVLYEFRKRQSPTIFPRYRERLEFFRENTYYIEPIAYPVFTVKFS